MTNNNGRDKPIGNACGWRDLMDVIAEECEGWVEERIPSDKYPDLIKEVRVRLRSPDPEDPSQPPFSALLEDIFGQAGGGLIELRARIGSVHARPVMLTSHDLDRFKSCDTDFDPLRSRITVLLPGTRRRKLVYYDVQARKRQSSRDGRTKGKPGPLSLKPELLDRLRVIADAGQLKTTKSEQAVSLREWAGDRFGLAKDDSPKIGTIKNWLSEDDDFIAVFERTKSKITN